MFEAMFALAVPDSLFALDGWLLRTTLGGGIVLLIGSLWMLLTRQPAQRQRIGELALLAALLVALPAAFPTWWSLPGTDPNSATNKVIFGKNPAIESMERNPLPGGGKLLAREELEDDEGEFDIVTFLQNIEKEQNEALKNDAGIKQREKNNDTDVKGVVAPVSLNWFRWTLRAIGLAYLSLAIALLIRCSVGYYGLWRYWQQRRPAPAHVHAILAELEPDNQRRPRIGVNCLVHGPVSYGLWKQTILLPPAFCNEGDPDKLRWILAHELTHLKRRDAWGCLLLALGGALYFHVPWFWWMKRHVRLAQEYLADAAAVKIANAVEYAQYLVSLTTLTSRPTLASSQAAGVFESPSDLYRRVHMLLQDRCVIERNTPRWWTVTAAASFLALAACTSGMNLYADEPEKKTPEKNAIELVVVGGDDKDKKQDKSVTLKFTGKLDDAGTHQVVIVGDDDKSDKKANVFRVQGQALGANQKQLDEALKKLDQALEKLPKQVDSETRARLEELKKSLKAMKETGGTTFYKSLPAQDGEGRVRIWENIDKNTTNEAKRLAEVRVKQAHDQALAAKDQAVAAEKIARAAQEHALLRWKEAKDGKDRDGAIKALEEAINEKEHALKALKSTEDRKVVAGTLRLNTDRTTTTAPSGGKGRLGVVVGDVESNLRSHIDLADGMGLVITEVIDPSPAWNEGRGLRSSDILLELNGKPVPANQDQFREMVGKLKEGTISVVVLRKGKKLTIGGIKLPSADKVSRVVLDAVPAGDAVKGNFRVQLADKMVAGHAVPAEVTIVDGKPAANHVIHLTPVQGVANTIEVNPLNRLNLKEHAVVADGKPLDVVVGELHVSPHLAAVTTTAPQGSSKPRLGVVLDAVPETVASQVELAEDRGLLVTEVVDGTAAQKAGFLKNDILIEFADKPVSRDHDAFTKFVKTLKPGKYTATVVRKGKEIRLRDINIADSKALEEEKKNKAKAWTVEGDEKTKEEKEEGAVKAKRQQKKEKEDFFPNANRGLGFQPRNGNTSVTLNNNEFTLRNTNEGKSITVTGKMNAGKPQPTSIIIKNDDDEKKYKAVKDVPEEDRAAVEKLLTSIRGNNFQFGGNGFNFNPQFNQQLEQQMKLFEKQMQQLGEGNPGFDQMEKQLEQLRQQLRKMRNNKDDKDN